MVPGERDKSAWRAEFLSFTRDNLYEPKFSGVRRNFFTFGFEKTFPPPVTLSHIVVVVAFPIAFGAINPCKITKIDQRLQCFTTGWHCIGAFRSENDSIFSRKSVSRKTNYHLKPPSHFIRRSRCHSPPVFSAYVLAGNRFISFEMELRLSRGNNSYRVPSLLMLATIRNASSSF